MCPCAQKNRLFPLDYPETNGLQKGNYPCHGTQSRCRVMWGWKSVLYPHALILLVSSKTLSPSTTTVASACVHLHNNCYAKPSLILPFMYLLSFFFFSSNIKKKFNLFLGSLLVFFFFFPLCHHLLFFSPKTQNTVKTLNKRECAALTVTNRVVPSGRKGHKQLLLAPITGNRRDVLCT